MRNARYGSLWTWRQNFWYQMKVLHISFQLQSRSPSATSTKLKFHTLSSSDPRITVNIKFDYHTALPTSFLRFAFWLFSNRSWATLFLIVASSFCNSLIIFSICLRLTSRTLVVSSGFSFLSLRKTEKRFGILGIETAFSTSNTSFMNSVNKPLILLAIWLSFARDRFKTCLPASVIRKIFLFLFFWNSLIIKSGLKDESAGSSLVPCPVLLIFAIIFSCRLWPTAGSKELYF